MAQGTLPQPMTLPAMQVYVAEVVAERGFTTDRNEVMILLVEEVGELARELTRTPADAAGDPQAGADQALAHELADIVLYLLDLANGFGVQLAALWPEHEADNDARFARRRHGEPARAHFDAAMTLADLVAHVDAKRRERRFEEGSERLGLLLTEEIGEIATEVRKGWKGLCDPDAAGREVIDALSFTLRLAWSRGVDIEAAITEKERKNAGRVWQY